MLVLMIASVNSKALGGIYLKCMRLPKYRSTISNFSKL